jgi:hypothetical protein
MFVSAVTLPGQRRTAASLGQLFSRRPVSGMPAHGRVWDLSGFLAIRPAPLPCSSRPRPNRYGLAFIGRIVAAPGPNTPKASARS